MEEWGEERDHVTSGHSPKTPLEDDGSPRRRHLNVLFRSGIIVGFSVLWALAGCTAEEVFTQGRENEPCSAVYPTCYSGYFAGCYLDAGKYTEGQFPGMRRILVTTSQVNKTIRVRLFFREMVFPGTEILAQAYEPDCGDVTRDVRQDVDVFAEAGDDQILMFDLDTETPGDHLVELFSDCSADYLLTAEEFVNE